ncbi:unnamed protein product [Schistosoma margrebowiei]|uniref:AB hydrolase-1 domain-containing protein n=1 Tax=Schistosoma margrebowiei TaxID=48269 RepID=A0AA84Z932_9TREM|nr:unnamed protein product [Schistosoma margrebowiei]
MNNALRLSRSVLQSADSSLKSSMVICHGLLGSKNNWKSISNALSLKNCGTNPTMRAFLLTNLGEKDGEIFWKVNLKAIKSCWNQITDFPAELSGRVFNQPVMFVAASNGEYLGQSDLPSVRKYFPQAKIVQIANTGHWVHFDAPNTVTKLITSFMLDKSFDPTSFADVKEIK